jgi:hypothetical protein
MSKLIKGPYQCGYRRGLECYYADRKPCINPDRFPKSCPLIEGVPAKETCYHYKKKTGNCANPLRIKIKCNVNDCNTFVTKYYLRK